MTLLIIFFSKANTQKKIDNSIVDVSNQIIVGHNFSGRSVNLLKTGGIIQSSFVTNNGKILLIGQFTGSEEMWKDALTIIRKIKFRLTNGL